MPAFLGPKLAVCREEHNLSAKRDDLELDGQFLHLINPAWTSPNEPFARLLFSLALQRSLSSVLARQQHYYPHRRR